MLSRHVPLLVTCILGASVLQLLAQGDQKAAAFEVASIKTSNSTDSNGGSVFQPNGRYMAHNQTLRNIILEWTPTTVATPLPNSDTQIGPEASLFTALREQLGLKLESTRGVVDVIVIDHVEGPTLD
jgi:hypothetical protein